MVRTLLTQKWESAGLKENNPFTVAWILEAVTALQEVSDPALEEKHTARIEEAVSILLNALNNPETPGGARIEPYPPSAYVTQLTLRVLRRRQRLDADTAKKSERVGLDGIAPTACTAPQQESVPRHLLTGLCAADSSCSFIAAGRSARGEAIAADSVKSFLRESAG
jgi:hypothetical protein